MGNKTYTNTSGKIEEFPSRRRERGFQGVGYKLSAQKMSNAETVKVDGREERRVSPTRAREAGTNGFAKLAVRKSRVHLLKTGS